MVTKSSEELSGCDAIRAFSTIRKEARKNKDTSVGLSQNDRDEDSDRLEPLPTQKSMDQQRQLEVPDPGGLVPFGGPQKEEPKDTTAAFRVLYGVLRMEASLENQSELTESQRIPESDGQNSDSPSDGSTTQQGCQGQNSPSKLNIDPFHNNSTVSDARSFSQSDKAPVGSSPVSDATYFSQREHGSAPDCTSTVQRVSGDLVFPSQ
mmetsp:Transcript_28558/g.44658  ORF Transcript_28558/g.44658 Transcript_28558/m.44658 type:complete len:207 (+) Transcript_28558:48-668(+)